MSKPRVRVVPALHTAPRPLPQSPGLAALRGQGQGRHLDAMPVPNHTQGGAARVSTAEAADELGKGRM